MNVNELFLYLGFERYEKASQKTEFCCLPHPCSSFIVSNTTEKVLQELSEMLQVEIDGNFDFSAQISRYRPLTVKP